LPQQNPAFGHPAAEYIDPGKSGIFQMNKNIRNATLLIAVGLSAVGSAYAAPVSLLSLGSAYTQNFNALGNVAGSTTNVTLPTGWAITETGGGARDDEQYAVDAGGSNTGDTYSYGTAGSTDRALGGLRSGTLMPLFGAEFSNNTGAIITLLDIAFSGEQWRLGTANRTDRLAFQYSTNATSLTTGTYVDFTALDFATPNTTSIGARNGNATGNFTAISATIAGLDIAANSRFWIRWSDIDASGADDGLAIDDFSLTARGAIAPAPQAVPEPGALALAGIALFGLLSTRLRSRH
jgi:hypothetical protein